MPEVQSFFEAFLWDCFRDGCTKRELRLSAQELTLLRQYYPQAHCHRQSDGTEQKQWYLVSLSPCGTHA